MLGFNDYATRRVPRPDIQLDRSCASTNFGIFGEGGGTWYHIDLDNVGDPCTNPDVECELCTLYREPVQIFLDHDESVVLDVLDIGW